MMGLWDRITSFMALQPQQERVELAFPDFDTQMDRLLLRRDRPHKVASVDQALSVPAIQRAVTLISHTVGSVSMQGWYQGSPMPVTPIVLGRPNPYDTPYDFYRDVAFYRATRGESIMWIANRDGAGFPIALVNIPPWEVQVQANPRNRLRPSYFWGDPEKPGSISGTRYSPANPEGAFVHIMYHRDITGLRGVGPLQMCGAAVSVAVEAQRWASNWFRGGGVPPIIVKKADDLDPTPGDGGLNEAQIFKRDWMSGEPNEPKVIDQGVESVQQLDTNPQGAQMLDSRQYENGDVARMFGIPGVLLEYNMPGSSLTYQSIPDVWVELLRGCLTPTYFEPIEAHISDLLPRTQAARFNTLGLQRADIKTRYDVYTAGIASGVLTVEQAQMQEGLVPGDIETMPVPPSPPQASIGLSREFRCDGGMVLRGQPTRCNKLLFVGQRTCPRCKKQYASVA